MEHDPEEIYKNTIQTVKNLVEKAGIDKADIAVLGISNQRETAVVWDKETGEAGVQCSGMAVRQRRKNLRAHCRQPDVQT